MNEMESEGNERQDEPIKIIFFKKKLKKIPKEVKIIPLSDFKKEYQHFISHFF
jgi:hypothetical protein